MTLEIMGYDLSRYVIGTIQESVDRDAGLASIAEAKTEIKLNNTNNRFSKLFSGINFTGEEVLVYDNYGDIFSGVIKSGRKSGGEFVLTCESFLSPWLRSPVVIEQTQKSPATIIRRAIESFQLGAYIDAGSFDYADARASGIYCNAYALAAQAFKLVDLINQVGELGGITIVYQDGMIRAVYNEYPDSSLRTITDRSFLDIPQLSYTDTYYTAYSVDYVGSGTVPLPATGGDASTGKVWTQATGAGSPVQVSDAVSAHRLGAAKIAAYPRPLRIITGRVDVNKVPVYVDDVYSFDLNSISETGIFRVTKYTRDENTATVTYQEVV